VHSELAQLTGNKSLRRSKRCWMGRSVIPSRLHSHSRRYRYVQRHPEEMLAVGFRVGQERRTTSSAQGVAELETRGIFAACNELGCTCGAVRNGDGRKSRIPEYLRVECEETPCPSARTRGRSVVSLLAELEISR